jgi:hypothetical protein
MAQIGKYGYHQKALFEEIPNLMFVPLCSIAVCTGMLPEITNYNVKVGLLPFILFCIF